MNISLDKKDNLNAVLNIKLEPADYKSQFEASIKNFQKKASMAGFRPGKVPSGMIKKLHGKGILADELNRLLNDSLYKYLEENNITYLGNPMPVSNGKESGDWENPTDFEFHYELGLAPDFDFSIVPTEEFIYNTVAVTDAMVDNYVADIRRRYGKFSNPELTEEGDILYGDFTELGENGESKENGITSTTTVALEFIKDDEERKKFIGVKNEDSLVFSPLKAIKDLTELAAMFKISKDEAANLTADFQFKVTSVNRIEKAEMNSELFAKVYGENVVATEDEFRNKIKEEISSSYSPQSDRILRDEMVNYILKKIELPLPDDFLKRWMQAANEKPVSSEEVEKEYPIHSKMIKWQLVMGKILKQNPDITVEGHELESYAKAVVRSQFTRYGIHNIEEDKLTSYASEMLKKESEVRRMSNELLDHKVFQLLKTSYKIKENPMPYDDFVKMAQEKLNMN